MGTPRVRTAATSSGMGAQPLAPMSTECERSAVGGVSSAALASRRSDESAKNRGPSVPRSMIIIVRVAPLLSSALAATGVAVEQVVTLLRQGTGRDHLSHHPPRRSAWCNLVQSSNRRSIRYRVAASRVNTILDLVALPWHLLGAVG